MLLYWDSVLGQCIGMVYWDATVLGQCTGILYWDSVLGQCVDQVYGSQNSHLLMFLALPASVSVCTCSMHTSACMYTHTHTHTRPHAHAHTHRRRQRSFRPRMSRCVSFSMSSWPMLARCTSTCSLLCEFQCMSCITVTVQQELSLVHDTRKSLTQRAAMCCFEQNSITCGTHTHTHRPARYVYCEPGFRLFYWQEFGYTLKHRNITQCYLTQLLQDTPCSYVIVCTRVKPQINYHSSGTEHCSLLLT